MVSREWHIDQSAKAVASQSLQLEDAANKAVAAGDFRLAAACYREALSVLPNDLRLRYNLATAALFSGSLEEAARHFSVVLDANPRHVAARSNMAIALLRSGQIQAAIVQFREVLTYDPCHVDAHLNLGLALHDAELFAEAMVHYDKAIELAPFEPDVHVAKGNALRMKRYFALARTCYEDALRLNANHHEANLNLGTLLLLLGEFERGWVLFEHRLNRSEAAPIRRLLLDPCTGIDRLDASSEVLILCEEGLGDSIQFVRYLSVLAKRVLRIMVLAPRPLERLFKEGLLIERLEVVTELSVPKGQACLPMMSLPRLLATRLDEIPAQVPYFNVEKSQRWSRPWMTEPARTLRVGIAWRGSSKHANDKRRSIDLGLFLTAIPVNVAVISLQVDINEPDRRLLANSGIRCVSDQLTDFYDTAQLIEALDLVVSVDTSVAHLSGALGKPTWVLLPFLPDWRWMINRNDSPWYPSMRLYRQTTHGDWTEALASVQDDLQRLTSLRPPNGTQH